jgi:hypothetical protein
MRKNLMLFVAILVCSLIPSLTAFAGVGTVVSGAQFVGDCQTLKVSFVSYGPHQLITVKVMGTLYGSTTPTVGPSVNISLSQSFAGTTSFTVQGGTNTAQTYVVTCPSSGESSSTSSFAPPSTQDGRVNVYAPTSVAVYEQVSTLGCDFIVIAEDPQGGYHGFVISQALRDEALDVPADGLLLDGDDYIQIYKLADGTYQVNAGPYNTNGDIYTLSLDGCPTKTNNDNKSTYRNGGE